MMSGTNFGVKCNPAKNRELEAARPASADEGTRHKLQQLHCLEEEVGVMMSDALPASV